MATQCLAVSQVGRFLRTCDVPGFHLRREMATQSPAVSQVGRFLQTCDVPCAHLRREMATQRLAASQVDWPTVAGLGAKCRWSVFFRSPATENGHPVPCSIAGLAVKCRRSAFFRSPATENGHPALAVSQVGRFLQTCDVPGLHLRRKHFDAEKKKERVINASLITRMICLNTAPVAVISAMRQKSDQVKSRKACLIILVFSFWGMLLNPLFSISL